jgi:hypothetical protein
MRPTTLRSAVQIQAGKNLLNKIISNINISNFRKDINHHIILKKKLMKMQHLSKTSTFSIQDINLS